LDDIAAPAVAVMQGCHYEDVSHESWPQNHRY
jgi:hypothetical protein